MERLAIPAGYEPYFAACLGYKQNDVSLPAPARNREVFHYIDWHALAVVFKYRNWCLKTTASLISGLELMISLLSMRSFSLSAGRWRCIIVFLMGLRFLWRNFWLWLTLIGLVKKSAASRSDWSNRIGGGAGNRGEISEKYLGDILNVRW